jgi:hypothetical protein
MAITLAEAKLNATTDLDLSVIDEFRTNPILDLITFDDAVNPAGGGATMTYGYRRLLTAPTAATRAINSEYAAQNVTTEQKTVNLGVLGGSFDVDRVVAKIGPAASGAVALNMSQKIKATQALFGDLVINGDVATDANGFDGLAKALVGTSTEDTAVHDWTGTLDQAKAFLILTDVDNLLSLLDGQAGGLIGNRKVLSLIKAASRFANQYVEHVGPRNTALVSYSGATLIDAGLKAGSATDVVPVNATDPDGAGPLVAGSTALYAVRFGLDGFHGVSTAGGSLVSTWLPDFSTPGAVKKGEVELGPVAVALKATKAAAVAKNIKVQ